MNATMGRIFCGFVLIGLLLAAECPAIGQNPKIIALNGKSGEPLKNVILLIFLGSDQSSLRSHAKSVDVRTDQDGVAVLPLEATEAALIQVWVDGYTQCSLSPNEVIFPIAQILGSGAVGKNACGVVDHESKPGSLTVYARRAHWWEAMRS